MAHTTESFGDNGLSRVTPNNDLAAEATYIEGNFSAIDTALDGKASLDGDTFTGDVTFQNIMVGGNVICDGVVQGGQLAGDGTTITNLTAANLTGTINNARLSGVMLKHNNLSDLGNASTSRTNLGLGTIATQASNTVSITGGSITGITRLTSSVLPTDVAYTDIANAYTAAQSITATTATTTPILTLTPTWNTASNVTALFLNLTNTASGSGSLLLDLQISSTSKFKVDKSGNVIAAGAVTIGVDLNFNTHRATNISYLKAGTGNTSIHVGNQQLINGTTAVVDWNSQKLTDGSGVDSVFWNLRTLHDAGTHTSIDWANRTLNDTSGNTLLNWLDTDLQITAGIVTTTGTQYVFGRGTALNANHIVECIAGDGDSTTPLAIIGGSSIIEVWADSGPSAAVAFGMAVPGSSAVQ